MCESFMLLCFQQPRLHSHLWVGQLGAGLREAKPQPVCLKIKEDKNSSSWGAGASAVERKKQAKCDSGEDKEIQQAARQFGHHCIDGCLWKEVRSICSLREPPLIQNLMASVVCEVILVSIINATFLSGFCREALKRALNPKQGTSEISQATRAR